MKFTSPTNIKGLKIGFVILLIFLGIYLFLILFDQFIQDININYHSFTPCIILFNIFWCFIIFNAFSDVWAAAGGLTFSFLIFKLNVPWDKVSGVYHSRSIPFNDLWLITVRGGLTPIHYIYSLLYFWKFSQGIYVYNKKEIIDELLKEINHHTGIEVKE